MMDKQGTSGVTWWIGVLMGAVLGVAVEALVCMVPVVNGLPAEVKATGAADSAFVGALFGGWLITIGIVILPLLGYIPYSMTSAIRYYIGMTPTERRAWRLRRKLVRVAARNKRILREAQARVEIARLEEQKIAEHQRTVDELVTCDQEEYKTAMRITRALEPSLAATPSPKRSSQAHFQ